MTLAVKPKLQKQSALKLAGRITPGALRHGETSDATFEASVELSQERSDVGLFASLLEMTRRGIAVQSHRRNI